jgi:hypothetical protein
VVIRQFDVFPNPSLRSREDAPYVVVLQSQYAGDLATTVIAPVYRAEIAERFTKLTVDVALDAGAFVVSIPELVAISEARLRGKITDLLAYEDDIRRAVDRLFTGF